MSVIHINGDGDPGDCNAKKGGCPFGGADEHFTTLEAAREAYEAKQSLLTLDVKVSKSALNKSATKAELKSLGRNDGSTETITAKNAQKRRANPTAQELSSTPVHRSVKSSNSSLTEAELKDVAEDKDLLVRRNLASKPKTPLEILTQLAKDNNYLVRTLVSENRSTPTRVLAKLSKDEDDDVREGVAENPNSTPEVLTQLAKDKAWSVREKVAFNPKAPPAVLAQLAKDKNDYVREAVAGNPNTPPETLDFLVTKNHIFATRNVAKNPSASSETLKALSEHEDWQVRGNVAENPTYLHYRAVQD